MQHEIEGKDSRCKDGWFHDFSAWVPSIYLITDCHDDIEVRQCKRCGLYEERMVLDEEDPLTKP